MTDSISLKEALEIRDANEEFPALMKGINVKTYIVRKHEMHIPYCVFKLSNAHPFRCVTCALGKGSFNEPCIHVARVRMEYPFHVEPKHFPDTELELDQVLKTIHQLDTNLLKPLDEYIVKHYDLAMYLKGTGFNPSSVHPCIGEEQKKMLESEEQVWTLLHFAFLGRRSNRFMLDNLLESKPQYDMLMHDLLEMTKGYNTHIKKCIDEHHEEEEKVAEIYLSDMSAQNEISSSDIFSYNTELLDKEGYMSSIPEFVENTEECSASAVADVV